MLFSKNRPNSSVLAKIGVFFETQCILFKKIDNLVSLKHLSHQFTDTVNRVTEGHLACNKSYTSNLQRQPSITRSGRQKIGLLSKNQKSSISKTICNKNIEIIQTGSN